MKNNLTGMSKNNPSTSEDSAQSFQVNFYNPRRIAFSLVLDLFTEGPPNSAKAREFQEFIMIPLVGGRTIERLRVGLGSLKEDCGFNL